MTHKHGGNAWVVIHDLGDGMVRVVGYAKGKIASQAFLAWNKMLTVTQEVDPESGVAKAKRIPEDLMPTLTQLREDLASGKTKVIDTRFVTESD